MKSVGANLLMFRCWTTTVDIKHLLNHSLQEIFVCVAFIYLFSGCLCQIQNARGHVIYFCFAFDFFFFFFIINIK